MKLTYEGEVCARPLTENKVSITTLVAVQLVISRIKKKVFSFFYDIYFTGPVVSSLSEEKHVANTVY